MSGTYIYSRGGFLTALVGGGDLDRRDRRRSSRSCPMNSIDFAQLDAADAAKWLEFVEKRGPSRLAELAGFLDDDGGPIGQADATWESLSPLWEWAVGFVARGGSELGAEGYENRAEPSPSVYHRTQRRSARSRKTSVTTFSRCSDAWIRPPIGLCLCRPPLPV